MHALQNACCLGSGIVIPSSVEHLDKDRPSTIILFSVLAIDGRVNNSCAFRRDPYGHLKKL
jgi:hypothetical protein